MISGAVRGCAISVTFRDISRRYLVYALGDGCVAAECGRQGSNTEAGGLLY